MSRLKFIAELNRLHNVKVQCLESHNFIIHQISVLEKKLKNPEKLLHPEIVRKQKIFLEKETKRLFRQIKEIETKMDFVSNLADIRKSYAQDRVE